MNLEDRIAEYPNFPKKGILFRDFSPILKDPSAMELITEEFMKYFHTKNIDLFAGIESRGFILATLLATKYNKGMIITISDGIQIVGMGNTIQIFIENAQNSVEITITTEDGTVIEELAFPASKEGVINQPWVIPKDLTPGTYILKVKDAFSSAEAQFTVN